MSNDTKRFDTNIRPDDRLICLAAIIAKYCPDNTAVVSANSLYELPYSSVLSYQYDMESGLVTIQLKEGEADEPESGDSQAQASSE